MPDRNSTFNADVGIIGAGPCGLFQVFELGLQGLTSIVFDAQSRSGGQCIELYPNKPIYDIPGLPRVSAAQLIENLEAQIAPFAPTMVLEHEITGIARNQQMQGFDLTTASGVYTVRYVVIATGAGAMTPVQLKVAGIEKFEQQSLFYRVTDPALHRGKKVVVLGGGDAALDWALELQPLAEEVILIHRSSRFRAAADTVNRYSALCDSGAAQMLQGQVTGYLENSAGDLEGLKVQCADNVVRRVMADHVLVFFGMSPSILALQGWGLEMERFQIKVRPDTFETSIEGIFAIGDCNYYPGKRKLILCGFHEAALAAFAISQYTRPDSKIQLEYTTTSPTLLKRLGV